MIGTLMAVAMVAAGAGTTPPVMEVDAATRPFMECVAHRESRGKATAVSRTGGHRGRYQVTDGMRVGMSWHVLPWLRTWHPQPRTYARQLRVTPMNQWPSRVQDAAFLLTLHHDGDRWSGWRHWYLAGSHCNTLVGR